MVNDKRHVIANLQLRGTKQAVTKQTREMRWIASPFGFAMTNTAHVIARNTVTKQSSATNWFASGFALAMTFLACFATLAMTLASCDSDDATQQPAPGGIRFEISFAPTSSQGTSLRGTSLRGAEGDAANHAATQSISSGLLPASYLAANGSARNDGATTRATTSADFKTAWDDGDQLGLFAVKRAPGAPADLLAEGNELHNLCLTYTGGTWSGIPTWPAGEGYVMDFYAYYPYDPGLTDPTAATFAVEADQDGTTAGRSNHSLSDLLMAAADNGGQGFANGSTVSLQFKHTMAMVEVTVGDAYGAIGPDDAPTATLHGMYRTAMVSLPDAATGTVPLGDCQDITMHRLATADGSLVYRACVPQQRIAAGATFFSLTLGSTTLEAAPLAADLILQAGHAERFTRQIPQAVALLLMKPQPPANSYMVAPGRAILIPVAQANRVLTDDALGAATDGLERVEAGKFTAGLVWGDTPVREASSVIAALSTLTRDGEGYLLVETGDTRGNAVVGITRDGDDAIRWSWHIWVTDEVGEATDNDTGVTWMDRNLGAAGTTYDAGGKNGLYYQWGRKDAFPGSRGVLQNQYYYRGSSTSSTNANLPTDSYTDLPGMVQNPLTFATNYTTYRGSLNVADATNNSWGVASGTKTLYDPCPPGWKVPPIGNWGNADDWGAFGSSGRIFKPATVNQFYPAMGYRTSIDGTLYISVGSSGYYWSATGGRGLNFSSSVMTPQIATDRAEGQPVRCIKE